jgi:acyl carrier protein
MGRNGQQAEKTIKSLLRRLKKSDNVDENTGLFSDGIGLDSLETAELSVLLEDELGHDPFSDGEMPQTVGEVMAFYDQAEEVG